MLSVALGGVVVDFLGTMVLGLAIGVFTIAIAMLAGSSEENALRIVESAPFLYGSSALGMAMTLAGGLVAATLKGSDHVRIGALSGAASLTIGGPLILLTDSLDPLWLNLPLFALQIPVATLGGRIAEWRAV